MRFMLLTPGTGHFYCGSCLRDDSLGRALLALGHEVTSVPIYLPLVLEEPGREDRVRMGGINVYLQQKSRLAGKLPRFLADLLDSPRLLRFASRRGSMTEAPGLGELTLSMLQGEHGRQAREVEKLVEWIARSERPDVIVLSNVMLAGVARQLRAAIDVPVVVTLQGEAPFLDGLPEPFRESAWSELRARVREIEAFVPVSESYGKVMRERLELPEDRVHVVHNGLDLTDFPSDPRPLRERRPTTVGFLARMCRQKGLHTLVDAFLQLHEGGRVPGVRLEVVGVELAEDRSFVAGLKQQVARAGCAASVEFHMNVSRDEKLAALSRWSVLSVPATYGESFGLFVLEALAAGCPVVQPRHAAFPELIEATGGGVLCEPDDTVALAAALESLLTDGERAQALADHGRAVVYERFTSTRMASEFVDVCRLIASPRS